MLLEEWNMDDALAVAREEAWEECREEERSYFIKLLEQGLTVEEIKERLTKTTDNKTFGYIT